MSASLLYRMSSVVLVLFALGHTIGFRHVRQQQFTATSKKIRSIEALVGEELSAIAFVRDYVELHFDGPVLRALSNPFVEGPDGKVAFPTAGSRDALCALIGETVISAEVRDDEMIRLAFRGGRAVIVPLDPASYIGPEAAHLMGWPDGMSIW